MKLNAVSIIAVVVVVVALVPLLSFGRTGNPALAACLFCMARARAPERTHTIAGQLNRRPAKLDIQISGTAATMAAAAIGRAPLGAISHRGSVSAEGLALRNGRFTGAEQLRVAFANDTS